MLAIKKSVSFSNGEILILILNFVFLSKSWDVYRKKTKNIFFSDHGADSDATDDVDEILDLDDYNRKLCNPKRSKSETDSNWSFDSKLKAEECLKPSHVVLPRLMMKPTENALSFNFAPSPGNSSKSSPMSKKDSPVKSIKPDPNLRERWVSSFARTTVTMTPFQTSSTSAAAASKPPCLSDTISKLKSSLLWGQVY